MMEQKNSKYYSPIIIPTLNRYEHFIVCIESLARNSYAEYTEVYISLDYPSKKEQWEGYQRIKAYLDSGINGFKEVNIKEQTENLGAYANEEFLIEWAFQKHNQFIFTEDDCEFAENFIEFMNEGLKIFKCNKDVFAICAAMGTTKKIYKNKSNIVKSCWFSGYGYGIWKDRYTQFKEKMNMTYMENVAKDLRTIWLIYNTRISLFFSFKCLLLGQGRTYKDRYGDIPYIDESVKIYLLMEKMYTIHPMPINTMAYCHGFDGSGEHCKKRSRLQNWLKHRKARPLNNDKFFKYKIMHEIPRVTVGKEKGLLINLRGLATLIYFLILLKKRKYRNV